MGYIWPAPRREPLETGDALALATAMTMLGAVALSGPLAHIYGSSRDVTVVRVTARPEAINFVIPTPPETPPAALSIPQPTVPPTPLTVTPSEVARSGAVPGASATESVMRPNDVVKRADTTRLAAPDAPVAPAVRGPVLAPLAYSRPTGPLVMRLLPGASTLNGRRLVSRDEQAGFVSEERERYEEARQLRPADVAARGGAASITTGWLGMGPSREERARDRAIHEGNLLRLAGLAARAQAKLDSARVADSLAVLSGSKPPPN